ncbi:MAG: hypothetical protein QGG71_21915, partial [Pirellulaceae bacterium]|nr:hypothetical protein [Pirellulaceae bacterium]
MGRKTISTLNIKVTASSEGVRKGMRAAKGEMRGFKVGAVSSLKGIAVAATATAAAIGLIVKVTQKLLTSIFEASSAFDGLLKRARALGVEVGRLEAVSLLAEFSGADADKIGTAMERLSISIGDATRGTGEAADAFRRLRLNVDELNAQSVITSMEDIGRALQSVGTRAEQLDLLSALVGSRQAGALINTFDAMAGGLGGIEELMIKIGLSTNKIDSEKIERMNDAIALAKKSAEGFWRQLAVELEPAITETALAVSEFLAELRPFIPEIAKATRMIARLVTVFDPFTGLLVSASRAMKALTPDKHIAKSFDGARVPVEKLTMRLRETRAAVDEIRAATADAFDPDKVARLREELESMSDVTAPRFRHGNTFGGVMGSAGGIATVNETARNRKNQIIEARKIAEEQAKLDRKRN